jgi:hypothetical protein
MPNSYVLLTSDKTRVGYPPGPAIYVEAAPVPVPEPVVPDSFLISGVVAHTGTNFSAGVEVTGFGTIFADAVTGSYGVLVAPGYSGSVIPHYCSGVWSPASQAYVNVQVDQPNQDYDLAATTDIAALTWLNDDFHQGQVWNGTVGAFGSASAAGVSGTYWSFAIGDGDGFAHINGYAPTIQTTLVNFSAPYMARLQIDYTGTQFTTNISGGVASSDSVHLEINGTAADFVTNSNGSFGGSLFVDGLIDVGCNNVRLDIGNTTGLSNTPPQWFYADLSGTFSVSVL